MDSWTKNLPERNRLEGDFRGGHRLIIEKRQKSDVLAFQTCWLSSENDQRVFGSDLHDGIFPQLSNGTNRDSLSLIVFAQRVVKDTLIFQRTRNHRSAFLLCTQRNEPDQVDPMASRSSLWMREFTIEFVSRSPPRPRNPPYPVMPFQSIVIISGDEIASSF